MTTFRSFIRRWAAVSAATLSGVAAVLRLKPLPADAQWLSFALWALYAGLTLLAVWGSLRAMDERDFPRFQSYFMGSLMGKILLTGVIMGIYAYTTATKTTAVLIPVGISYLPFLLLETRFLAKASRERDPYRRPTDRSDQSRS